MERAQDLLDEVWRLTEAEGLVDFCRELRDSMTFYDRDVLIAICSGILEGMMVTALFLAGLESLAEFHKAATALRFLLARLPERLRYRGGALDVQAFLERFLETGGRTLREEYPALVATFDHYFRDDYDLEADVNQLLWQARRLREAGDPAALVVVGRAGAAVLRGAQLRPIWLKVGGAIVPWVHALAALAETIATLPQVRLPLGTADEERRRRQAAIGVIDLSDMRRRLRPQVEEEEEERPDEVDAVLHEVLSASGELSQGVVRRLQAVSATVLPILLAMATSRDVPGEEDDRLAICAIRALAAMGSREAVEPFLEIVASADPSEEVFDEARKALIRLGQVAKNRILRFADREADLETAVYLSEILAKGRQDERVFRFLTDLFRRLSWREGKEVVAASLAEYGDARALPLLHAALAEPSGRDASQEATVRSAISRLERKAREQRERGERRRPSEPDRAEPS